VVVKVTTLHFWISNLRNDPNWLGGLKPKQSEYTRMRTKLDHQFKMIVLNIRE
jgi:hypothetical protein